MEIDLTLQKAITIASQIESAIAEAKAMTPATEAKVGVPHANVNLHKFKENAAQTKPIAIDFKHTGQQKCCYHCGSNSHLTNNPKCAAKNSKCKQYGKTGRFAKLCHGAAPTCNVQEVAVPDLTVLSIASTSDVTQGARLTCTVSLHVNDGQPLIIDLLVDTGSAVSILPEHVYRQNFIHVPLTKPTVRLVTYSDA